MSLILEALRKMEQDRNSRRGAAQNIRPEVLRYRAAPAKPRSNGRFLPLALGAVLLACGIAGVLYLRGNHAESARQETAPVAIALPATPTAPVPPAAQATPAQSVAPADQSAPAAPAALPAVSLPVAGPIAAPVAEPRAVSAPAGKDRSQPLRPPVAAAPPRRSAPEKVTQPKPPPREAASVVQAAPADIAITGIAWQDERSLRRAVVNGTLVMEGAEVAGARVVEIREDRVRLSRGGQVFDALFSAGFAR